MAIIEPFVETFREYVSMKALDLAETLPQFQGGRIYHMQLIREHERKRADKLFEDSKQPDDASIKLRSVTLVVCYEFEQFSSVHKTLKKAFPGNKKLIERIEEIRKRENALDRASWSSLGTIVGVDNKYLIVDINKQSELPSNVERIHLSHHRLLPSLASLEFTIIVTESFQENLRGIAERYYLPKSVSASLWPNKFFRGHSMSCASGAENAVAQRLREFIRETAHWLIKDLRLNKKHIHISAAHPLYQLEVPSEKVGLVEYTKSKRVWLSKYGYRDTAFHGYSSDSVIFCPAEKQEGFPKIDPLFFEKQEHDHFWLIDGLLKGMVCSSTLLTRLAVYKISIESLRSKGLMKLNARWRMIRKSGRTIYELKHLILRIKRMLSEFQKSKHWLHHSLEDAASLKSVVAGQESTFSSNMLAYLESELKSLASSAVMMDQALSDRLATENIYVMYQLQRRVFWLTVVGVCIAAIGLVATWDKIEPYAQQLFSILRYVSSLYLPCGTK